MSQEKACTNEVQKNDEPQPSGTHESNVFIDLTTPTNSPRSQRENESVVPTEKKVMRNTWSSDDDDDELMLPTRYIVKTPVLSSSSTSSTSSSASTSSTSSSSSTLTPSSTSTPKTPRTPSSPPTPSLSSSVYSLSPIYPQSESPGQFSPINSIRTVSQPMFSPQPMTPPPPVLNFSPQYASQLSPQPSTPQYNMWRVHFTMPSAALMQMIAQGCTINPPFDMVIEPAGPPNMHVNNVVDARASAFYAAYNNNHDYFGLNRGEYAYASQDRLAHHCPNCGETYDCTYN